MRFESVIYEMFSNVMRLVKAQPINLGGYASAGGGDGGPPGGFIGYLPQTRVAYDLTEASSLDTPASGMSLLDNLNHMRYRMDTIEASGNAGIRVKQDDSLIASGVQTLDFQNFFEVSIDSPTEVAISLLSSGVASDVTYSGVFGEDLTSYIDGGTDHFDLVNTAYSDTLEVYLNGVRQSASEYTVDGDNQGFTTSFTPLVGDTLFVDYVVASSGYFHTHSQYAELEDVYTREEITYLLQAFSRTVNQQIIFTAATIASGIIPYELYAHDVNDGATISEIFVSFHTEPASEVRIDVLKNGSTIFSEPSYVSIASGETTGSRSTSFFDSSFVKDDYFQVAIEQGDAVASGMAVHIRFSYELD